MKTLKKVTLKDCPDHSLLSDEEQKFVLGGMTTARKCNVSTTCDDGTELEITDCIGNCYSESGISVSCVSATQTLTKSCTIE